MAARVAEQLQEETHLRVETVPGGLGELRVTLDGRNLFESGRLWYPRVKTVIDQVRGGLPR